MSYQRVIPRDLFNEADLLKCLGKLYLMTEYRTTVRILHSGHAFNIVQNSSDGSIYCGNICVIIGSRTFDHFRPHHKATSCPADWFSLAMFLEGGLMLAARGGALEPFDL